MLTIEDYNKSKRVFETFVLIKNKQATTRTELAKALNCTTRTITNHVSTLNTYFGTDISKGEGNKYVIHDEGVFGYLKGGLLLTAEDVVLIVASLVQSQTFMETKMSIIKNTLLDILPNKESDKLRQIMHFEKTASFDEQNIEFNVKKIREAIAEEKNIKIIYKNAAGDTLTYKIIPYSLACELGKYYIIGKSNDRDSLMHLRIDRIKSVEILDERGKREEKFNVYNYLKRTWYMYGGPEINVIVRFKQECKTVVTERNMAEGEIIEENAESFTYKFKCNGTNGIKLWLMGFGGGAEVLEPQTLREEIKNEIKKMAENYS